MSDHPHDHIRRHRDTGAPASGLVIWSCLSKVRFPDEYVARARTAQILEAGGADRPELWVYPCDHCRGWHMTKRPQRDRASVTAGDLFRMVFRR